MPGGRDAGVVADLAHGWWPDVPSDVRLNRAQHRCPSGRPARSPLLGIATLLFPSSLANVVAALPAIRTNFLQHSRQTTLRQYVPPNLSCITRAEEYAAAARAYRLLMVTLQGEGLGDGGGGRTLRLSRADHAVQAALL
jgi:hypothetical protein